jgi:hypothetical protein
MRRAIIAAFICLCVVTGSRVGSGQGADPAEFDAWSDPVNLGAAINTAGRETGASVSRDGLSLYFDSGNDLYVSQRRAVDLPWETRTRLDMLNSASTDAAASLSRDNRFLFFISNRAGGPLDLWISQRSHTNDDFGWEPPVALPSPPNGAGLDVAPTYFENPGGPPQLYFANGPNAAGLDLYVTDQQEDGTWAPPENLVLLNSPFEDSGSAIRFDGLEMIFSSRRGGPDLDLYVTRRAHRWDPWSPPENLGATINSLSSEFTPHLSPNGRTLYFASSRPDGGFGNFDIYASTRRRIR